MFARIIIPCILVLIPLTTAARADEAKPDVSGPRAAIKALFEAIEAADSAAVRAQFQATTPQEIALADAYAEQIAAAKAFGDIAKTKYGVNGDSLTKGTPMRDSIAKLEQAEILVTGDQATVKMPGQARSLRLAKVDGRWRVVLSDYAGATPENIASQTAVLKEMGEVFRSVAADISADKFASTPDAQRALQQKLQAVIFNSLQKNPPTSRPATTQSIPKK